MSSPSIHESYAYCHELMRSAARNFYYGMRLLPETKRRGMYALYSFMRLCDDIGDEAPVGGAADAALSSLIGVADAATGPTAPSTDPRRARLEAWRAAMHQAIDGQTAGHRLWPAFHDTVRRFGIPVKLFDDAIDGQIQDLVQHAYSTFQELYQYCYRVASTVGIAAIHIWGFSDAGAIQLAEERGIAMQLTNILRDLREDADRGRCYLPDDDRARFRLRAVGGQ